MQIKIALTNLGKYNEGELLYTWLDLPATEDEVHEALAEIKLGTLNEDGEYTHGYVEQDEHGNEYHYEEHFITDYEAPFKIGEYDSLDRLNELAEQLDGIDIPERSRYGHYEAEDVLRFADELEDAGLIQDKHYHVGNIVDDDTLTENVYNMVANCDADWTRVKFYLQHADIHAYYHLIDGYDNVTVLTDGTLEAIMSDMLNEVRSK